jgi:hypothetical protein
MRLRSAAQPCVMLHLWVDGRGWWAQMASTHHGQRRGASFEFIFAEHFASPN